MPVNSFTNRYSGEQLWGVVDITLVAGIGSGTWRLSSSSDTLVFISSITGTQADPTVLIPIVLAAAPLGTLTISASATTVTVSSTNVADVTQLRVYGMRDLNS